MLMAVYCALNCDTSVEVDVRLLGCGAGEIDCLECGGDGDWTKYHPEPETGPHPCVTCKGTGKQLVSV